MYQIVIIEKDKLFPCYTRSNLSSEASSLTFRRSTPSSHFVGEAIFITLVAICFELDISDL